MPDDPNNLDCDWRQRVLRGPTEATVRDLGVSVRDIVLALSRGVPATQVMADHPGLQGADLRACLAYAAEVLLTAPTLEPVAAETQSIAPPAPPEPSNAAEAETLAPPAALPDQLPTIAPAAPIAASGPIQIPGYEILQELGRGGMGVVYKARNIQLDRVVALKMILAAEFADDDMRERFRREARAAAQLPHVGIVQVYEVGEHDGRPFIVQEFVSGGSLTSWTDAKPWSATQAAELVEALARAVQVAHDHDIIHRDLKPDNVLMTEDGQPKIADFGLAKQLDVGDGKTRTGAILGTPEYMAPEQAGGRSKEIGPAADVYALGAILYRLMTGRPPFRAGDMFSLLTQVLEQEPRPLRDFNRRVPYDLETITLTCLMKDPRARYPSAAALADDLRRFLNREPIKARQLTNAERFGRYVRKRPGSFVARCFAVVELLGAAAILIGIGGGPLTAGVPLLAAAIPSAVLTVAAAVRVRKKLWAMAAAVWTVPAVGAVIAIVSNGMNPFGGGQDVAATAAKGWADQTLWWLSGPVLWLLFCGILTAMLLGLATATLLTRSRLVGAILVVAFLSCQGLAYLMDLRRPAVPAPAYPNPYIGYVPPAGFPPGPAPANQNLRPRAVLAATTAGLLAAPLRQGPLLAAGVLYSNKGDPPALPKGPVAGLATAPGVASRNGTARGGWDLTKALSYLAIPLIAASVGVVLGGLIRFVHWSCGGQLLDVAAGAIIGAPCCVGVGSVAGAILGAVASRKPRRSRVY